jgi:hypothetical protein
MFKLKEIRKSKYIKDVVIDGAAKNKVKFKYFLMVVLNYFNWKTLLLLLILSLAQECFNLFPLQIKLISWFLVAVVAIRLILVKFFSKKKGFQKIIDYSNVELKETANDLAEKQV